MITNKNDNRILTLKKQIEEKKRLIGESVKFNPVTNCSIEFESERYNLHTLNKEKLINLLIRLNMYRMSIEDLGVNGYEISGYDISEWMFDIRTKIDSYSRKEEQKKLKAMELQLDKLLSEEKKTELELNDIESMLK